MESATDEQVPSESIDVGVLVQVMAGRARVVGFDYHMPGDFALDSEKPVVSIGLLKIGVRREDRYAHSLDPVGGVPAELERGVNGESQIWLGGVAQRVGKRRPKLGTHRRRRSRRRIVAEVENGRHEKPVVGDA